jgi:Predicted membrane protein (DUF2079)
VSRGAPAAHAAPRTRGRTATRVPRQVGPPDAGGPDAGGPSATGAAAGTRPQPGRPLRRVRRIGYAILAVQLLCFCAWSGLLYHRFAVTFDFAVYHQPWYLIAHGDLDPYSSLARLPFWRNDAEFAIWPLAALYWVWPHDVVLLWVQDIGVVAAEALAFGWLCELAGRWRPGRGAALLASVGLILLVANPWVWWGISFDYHEECLAIPFAVLLARDLAQGRRRMWLWLVPILAAGAPAATYVVGIGLGGLVAARRTRVTGLLMVVAGAAYSLLIVYLHADDGAPLARHYGYLVVAAAGTAVNAQLSAGGLVRGIAGHPMSALHALWAKRIDVLANVAPGGLLGLGFVRLLPLMLVVLLANALSAGARFAEPLFQSMPIYVLLPVGTVAALAWLATRHRRAALVLAVLVTVQALGWAVVWGPRTPDQWLRVSAPAATTLAAIEARIPASAEVIASQGVVGRFSGRAAVHELVGPGTTPVDRGQIWFVLAPAAGIELQSTASAVAMIGELAGPLHATLVTHANGIWAFRWHAPAGQDTLRIPAGSGALPAWAVPGTGRDVLTGPVTSWHAVSGRGAGYVADGLSWQDAPGRYQARVTLAASGPVNIEVWNDNGGVLLARRRIPATDGKQAVSLPVDATTAYPAPQYAGWGPFRADFVAPPPGQRLEIRIWSPGGAPVSVYSASLTPAG